MPDLQTTLSKANIGFQNTSVTFRHISGEDIPVLKQIYASTRLDELAMTDWSDEQKQQFIDHQFNAQHQHYQIHYADAEFLLLIASNQVMGRLYLQHQDKQLCLIDITLLPAFQKQGIGQQILTWILNQAKDSKKLVTLHVESHNPAYQWYLKQGFKNIEDRGVYQYLEWHP